MDVTETDLPGVGKKHEMRLGDGRRLVVVTHNSGRRELYRKDDPEADAEKLLDLSDRQARTLGTILEGAYFQPVRSERVQTLLSEGTLLEWYGVDDGSPLVGESLETAAVGRDTGVRVVAIEREDGVVAGPGPDERIAAGDTLVVVGSRADCDRFERLLDGED
jgi:TrkA domain protein